LEEEMPSLKHLNMDPSAEAAFRRGFSHGVEITLFAVERRLTDADRKKLRMWRETILEWRGPLDSENFETPKAPDLG
jgi:hypothetical protein